MRKIAERLQRERHRTAGRLRPRRFRLPFALSAATQHSHDGPERAPARAGDHDAAALEHEVDALAHRGAKGALAGQFRRDAIIQAGLVLAAPAVEAEALRGALAGTASAATAVSESNPQASALGYEMDATKATARKDPKADCAEFELL